MKTLREYIAEAKAKKIAIGHFNFSTIEGLYAICRAAKKLDVPVILGLSEGEEAAIGTKAAVALVRTIREEWNMPVFLNADHHYSFESVQACIDAGFDAVIYDGAKLPFAENVVIAKQCVEYAKKISQETGRDILVEVELGYIGEGSSMRDQAPEGIAVVTDPADAKRFMDETGADLIAPAVGTFHGMLKTAAKPRLNIESIQALNDTLEAGIVLHGGSGNDADFTAAIDAGVIIIHVNTELRRAYTEAVRSWLIEHPDEIAPYKYGTVARDAMEKVTEEKLKIFNKIV